MTANRVNAKDCKCCECGAEASAFWPCIDPDIPSSPYCRECLDKAQQSLLIRLHDEGLLGGHDSE